MCVETSSPAPGSERVRGHSGTPSFYIFFQCYHKAITEHTSIIKQGLPKTSCPLKVKTYFSEEGGGRGGKMKDRNGRRDSRRTGRTVWWDTKQSIYLSIYPSINQSIHPSIFVSRLQFCLCDPRCWTCLIRTWEIGTSWRTSSVSWGDWSGWSVCSWWITHWEISALSDCQGTKLTSTL